MAQPYCTGPVDVFVWADVTQRAAPRDLGLVATGKSSNNLGDIVYLGTGELGPVVELTPYYYRHHTDDLGGRHGPPADYTFLGESALVQVALTRWNEATYAAIGSKPSAGVPRGPRGTVADRHVGGMMVGDNLAHQLWLRFRYYPLRVAEAAPGTLAAVLTGAAGGQFAVGAAARQAQIMPAGYRFPRAMLVAPERLDPLGTRPRKVSLTWQCCYGKPSSPDAGQSVRVLYDHDMTGLANRPTD